MRSLGHQLVNQLVLCDNPFRRGNCILCSSDHLPTNVGVSRNTMPRRAEAEVTKQLLDDTRPTTSETRISSISPLSLSFILPVIRRGRRGLSRIEISRLQNYEFRSLQEGDIFFEKEPLRSTNEVALCYLPSSKTRRVDFCRKEEFSLRAIDQH